MLHYLIGFLLNVFNPAVSLFTFIDTRSNVDRKSKVNRFAKVVNSKVGRYSYVGARSWVIHSEIGHFCSIANDVHIGLAKHTLNYLSTSLIFTEKKNGTGHSWISKSCFVPSERTIIGNDVWIGYRAMIKGGIKVGDGAIIGAGSMVTKNVPPYAIFAGVPAKIIRYRFSQDIIKELEQLKWWNWNEKDLKENISSFQNDSIEIDELTNIERGVNLPYNFEIEERRVA